MCGIVGLLLKKPALREQLGELMVPMLIGMTSAARTRPASRSSATPARRAPHKLSLFWGEGAADWKRPGAASCARSSTASTRFAQRAASTRC